MGMLLSVPLMAAGFGFIAYAAVKLLSGRAREANPALVVLAALFVLKYALL